MSISASEEPEGERRRGGRRLWVVALACLAIAIVAGGAAAAAPGAAVPPGAGDEARRVLQLSYGDFLAYKNSGEHPFAFDFSSDGCTDAPTVEKGFDGPCQLHDFGYRNYGNTTGLMLGRDDDTRLLIDDRFHREMDRYCDDTYRGLAQQGNNQVCHYRAQVTYNGVRRFGEKYFYA